MKTIDKAIKGFKSCYIHCDCTNCPYFDGKKYCEKRLQTDVLQNLKDYRDFIRNLANALINAYKSIEPYIEEIEEDKHEKP